MWLFKCAIKDVVAIHNTWYFSCGPQSVFFLSMVLCSVADVGTRVTGERWESWAPLLCVPVVPGTGTACHRSCGTEQVWHSVCGIVSHCVAGCVALGGGGRKTEVPEAQRERSLYSHQGPAARARHARILKNDPSSHMLIAHDFLYCSLTDLARNIDMELYMSQRG